MENADRIISIVKGNPGALAVVAKSIKQNSSALDAIEASGLMGSDIWVRYKDECGEDIDRFLASLKNRK